MTLIRYSRPSALLSRLGALITLAFAFVSEMHAGNAGNLPWERPMTAIATSLTGPVAYAIGLIGIAIAGGAMLWGGIGANAAGVGGTLSPGDVFSQGLTISAALMDAASNSGFFDHPGTSLAMMFSALLIVISYIIITINFIVTVVESYLVVSVGFIFLGFGGSRWTAPYVERYIGLAVAIGIKIVLLYCLISTGLTLGRGCLDEAQGIGTAPHPNMTAFDVMGAALIFMMLCWQIPKVFAAVLGGDLVGIGVAVATGGLAAGAVATGALAAVAGGVSALAVTSSAAGAGGSSSGAAGAVASVGSARASGSGSCSACSVPPPAAPSTRQTSAMDGVTAQRQPDPPPSSAQLSAAPADPVATTASSSSSAQSVKTVFGGLSNQLSGAKRHLGPLPSDAAPNVSPPRMPIDQTRVKEVAMATTLAIQEAEHSSEKSRNHATARVTSHNPYLAARREWDERYGDLITRARNWRVIALVCAFAALLGTAGTLWLSTRSRVIPYVVLIDNLGRPIVSGLADQAGGVDDRLRRTTIFTWIENLRLVPTDGVAQRKAIDRVYAQVASGSAAQTFISEFYRSDPPFKRAQTENGLNRGQVGTPHE